MAEATFNILKLVEVFKRKDDNTFGRVPPKKSLRR